MTPNFAPPTRSAERSVHVRRTTGFTLIELLVVISIIALLISILMPALSSAREAGKAVVCLNQVKQFGMAFSSYTMDAKDSYPPFDLSLYTSDPNLNKYRWNWGWVLHNKGYITIPMLFQCPTAMSQMKYTYTNGANDVVANPTQATPFLYTAYGYNDNFIGSRYNVAEYYSSGVEVRRLPARNVDIKNPTECMVMTETSYPATPTQGHYRLYTNGVVINNPHKDSANVLWADGHASRISDPKFELDGDYPAHIAKYYDWY